MHEIHLRLRHIRRLKNLSQADLAEKLGISRQAVIALEQGVSRPSLPVVVALLRELDVPFQDLFGEAWSPFRMAGIESSEVAGTELAQYRHAEGSQNIPISLVEDDMQFYLTAELPGVREQELTIDLSHQHLLLMASKPPRIQQGALTLHYNELRYGSLIRIISLPSPIDTTGAQAEFSRGTLYLTLPKLLPDAKRRITFTTTGS